MKTIVLEGLPAGGKTTLGRKLQTNFKVIPEYVNDVSTNKYDETIYFKNDVEKIKIAKESNKVCFIERGYPSTLAYNYSRLMVEGVKDYYKILEMYANYKKNSMIFPDLYILLDIPIELSIKRKIWTKGEHFIWSEERYLKHAKYFYDNYFKFLEPDIPIVTIDVSKDIDAVYKEIIGILK